MQIINTWEHWQKIIAQNMEYDRSHGPVNLITSVNVKLKTNHTSANLYIVQVLTT